MTRLTLGAFPKQDLASQKDLTLLLTSTHGITQPEHWKNYGRSADFLGDYCAAFFREQGSRLKIIHPPSTIKAMVSYIANELIENAAKYSDESSDMPIAITLRLYQHKLILEIVNYANATVAKKYHEFVQGILKLKVLDAYTQQLEKIASGQASGGIGLLTLMNDYNASCGWTFESQSHLPTLWRIEVVTHVVF
ncbi:MAG TPA: ATP-binding protein [Stenomitos sp.]